MWEGSRRSVSIVMRIWRSSMCESFRWAIRMAAGRDAVSGTAGRLFGTAERCGLSHVPKLAQISARSRESFPLPKALQGLQGVLGHHCLLQPLVTLLRCFACTSPAQQGTPSPCPAPHQDSWDPTGPTMPPPHRKHLRCGAEPCSQPCKLFPGQ